MKCLTAICAAVALTAASSTMADVPLGCAQDGSTFAVMCFAIGTVRSNGQVRAAKLWNGGRRIVGRAISRCALDCAAHILKMTDETGVAFMRSVPNKQVGIEFAAHRHAMTRS